MIGWLKNTNVMEKKKIEPGATFSALEDHWKQISEVMKNSQVCIAEMFFAVFQKT